MRRTIVNPAPARTPDARSTLPSWEASWPHPQPHREAAGWVRADWLALAALAVVLAVVGLNRVVFDVWLSRFDLYTFFVPWYAYLGEGLRQFTIPGWNPHVFSGTPFAADPESGWMYLPAMVIFALTEVLAGFKALLLLHLAVAGFSTYAYGRVLGLGPFAALVAAIVFALGPLLQWTSYCCLVLVEYAVWVPPLLLGIELALRAGDWRGRLLPWFLTGFALSQMLAGWVGQGWLVGPILIAAYTTYRALLSSPRPEASGRDRLLAWVTTGVATVGSGLALGAAGILPRLVYTNESNLAGGVYSQLGAAANDKPAWAPVQLIHQLLGDDYGQRFSALGGAVIVLALLAPVIAGRRHGVPFFAVLTLVSLILTLDPTPLHAVFYLIPRFQEMHQHDPWRSYALGIIGPAMLCGATIQELPRWRGKAGLLPVLVAPLLLMGLGAIVIQRAGEPVSWAPLIAAAVTVALLVIAVAAPRGPAGRSLRRLAPLAILAVIIVQPTGLELTGSWLGFPRNESWEEHWRPDPVRMERLRSEISPLDRPGGGGEYLQTRLAGLGPFRYLGYGGAGHPDGGPSTTNYMGRRLNPNIHAILVNGRAMFLGLHDTQGYNPLELGRYAELITAINGTPQDYHLAYLLPSGIGSSLLDLLNLRYILVDATLPADRDDTTALAEVNREVFRAENVIVYERQPAPRHAWIVHDVRQVAPGEALSIMSSGLIDLTQTALVEGMLPEVSPAPAGVEEAALVTEYEPDRLTVATSSAGPGLLVLSEIYASGWQATIDGEAVPILPTNHALRGVPLPAGEHTVELRYEPLSLRVGLVISLAATVLFIAVIAFALWSWWRQRAVQPAGSAMTRQARRRFDSSRPAGQAKSG
jgi:hypothetical protein